MFLFQCKWLCQNRCYCGWGVSDGEPAPLFGRGEQGPHLTQNRLGRGLPPSPPYQVASWSMQQYLATTDMGRKLGGCAPLGEEPRGMSAVCESVHCTVYSALHYKSVKLPLNVGSQNAGLQWTPSRRLAEYCRVHFWRKFCGCLTRQTTVHKTVAQLFFGFLVVFRLSGNWNVWNSTCTSTNRWIVH